MLVYSPAMAMGAVQAENLSGTEKNESVDTPVSENKPEVPEGGQVNGGEQEVQGEVPDEKGIENEPAADQKQEIPAGENLTKEAQTGEAQTGEAQTDEAKTSEAQTNEAAVGEGSQEKIEKGQTRSGMLMSNSQVLEWDGSSIDGGNYKISSGQTIRITGDVTVSNATITVEDNAVLEAAGSLELHDASIYGRVKVSGLIDMYGSTVSSIEAEAFQASIWTQSSDKGAASHIGKITGKILTVVNKNSSTIEEMEVSNNTTVTCVTNEANIGRLTFSGKGKISNAGGGARISTLNLTGGKSVSNSAGAQIDVANVSASSLENNNATIGTVDLSGGTVTNFGDAQDVSKINNIVMTGGTVNNGSAYFDNKQTTVTNVTVSGGSYNNIAITEKAEVSGNGKLTNDAKGTVKNITMKGGSAVNNGSADNVDLFAGAVTNTGTISVLHSIAGGSGSVTDSGNITNRLENVVHIILEAPLHGSLTVKENGTAINSGTYITAGKELTVEAKADEGYRLSKILINDETVSEGTFSASGSEMRVTAEFASNETLLPWDGTGQLTSGKYEISTPVVISERLTIPAGVEIHFTGKGSLTVEGGLVNHGNIIGLVTVRSADGEMLASVENRGDIQAVEALYFSNISSDKYIGKVTVGSGCRFANSANGTVGEAVFSGGEGSNGGTIEQLSMDSGTFFNNGTVKNVSVNGGVLNSFGDKAAIESGTLVSGTADFYDKTKVQSFWVKGGTAWITDEARVENLEVSDGLVHCEKHYNTALPGSVGALTAGGGTIYIGEGCKVDSLTVPGNASPFIKNEGEIKKSEGKMIDHYNIPQKSVKIHSRSENSITLSWEAPEQVYTDGTKEKAENVSYSIVWWNETLKDLDKAEILTYPEQIITDAASSKTTVTDATSATIELPNDNKTNNYLYVIAKLKPVVNSDLDRIWVYDEVIGDMRLALNAPEHPVWDTGVQGRALWDKVEKAGQYRVSLYKEGGSEPVLTRMTSDTYYDFAKDITAPGNYVFNVAAIGDEKETLESPVSEFSPIYTFAAKEIVEPKDPEVSKEPKAPEKPNNKNETGGKTESKSASGTPAPGSVNTGDAAHPEIMALLCLLGGIGIMGCGLRSKLSRKLSGK